MYKNAFKGRKNKTKTNNSTVVELMQEVLCLKDEAVNVAPKPAASALGPVYLLGWLIGIFLLSAKTHTWVGRWGGRERLLKKKITQPIVSE